MKSQAKKKADIEKLVLSGILTAIVVVLQYLGSFIKFGPFSISLILIPIVIGAATCSTKISAWLGFVFGVVVLMTDAAAFLAISVPGTVITVLAKGIVCGIAAGLAYKLIEKKNIYVATAFAAIVAPIANTGIFLLGCVVFFFDTIKEWGAAAGFENAAMYMILGLVGVNFLIELAINVVLSPVIVRILNIRKKNK